MDGHRGDSVGEILVIDDTPENLVAIEAALDGLGDGVVLVTSGQDGLRQLLERDFALILLDVKMPTMDGLETARMVRQRERTRHVPIIFLTAYDRTDEDVLEAYHLGAVDFLFKPISPEVLRAKASVFVELQRRTAEVARQALLISEHERVVREQALTDLRQKMEAEALRRRLTEQRKHAQVLTYKNLELEQIRLQLERSNARLAEDDRRKDEFIAVLAHELRNPLAAIMSGIELLQGSPSPELISALRPILARQGGHLLHLVDDLLDMSRITSGKLELRQQPVRVSDIVEGAVGLAMPDIDAKRHSFVVDCRCPDACVRGDPVRLVQIIANLLSNAARYTDQGGHVWLSVRNDRESGRIQLVVKDDGHGMSAELIPRVFDMFVQADAKGGGLGIGLTLVRRLVDMHGGEIRVHSDGPGLGTEVEIWLPESWAEASGKRPTGRDEPRVPVESHGLRVALIDDHTDVRELTRSVLENWGHLVFEASNGSDGVALVMNERPDVAIIDIGLPDIEGYEVARRLRERLGRAECPRLIAMTGFSQKRDRDRAREAGFDVHLSKPAEFSDLRAAMFETHD
ncbi:ATP-binding response regulator [Paraliomyxa miuraensis]|uniref:ATP-binding response regulator n=1 Tax=Paraliomyxa miuraensis TaxID=376150 RepID=UPI00225C3ED0|nr:response regulator [Paraliomyxa miuraensis]MCX4247082.1 response regulator [Paraliomyxa miuraensis]